MFWDYAEVERLKTELLIGFDEFWRYRNKISEFRFSCRLRLVSKVFQKQIKQKHGSIRPLFPLKRRLKTL